MVSVRTQYREEYAPRTTSKAALKALVKALADFKPGLPTTSRKIKARAISAGKTTDLEGPESWKEWETEAPDAGRGDYPSIEREFTHGRSRS